MQNLWKKQKTEKEKGSEQKKKEDNPTGPTPGPKLSYTRTSPAAAEPTRGPFLPLSFLFFFI
jgi:hypothetical protein